MRTPGAIGPFSPPAGGCSSSAGELARLLRCPRCRGSALAAANRSLLECPGCGSRFPIRGDIPDLVPDLAEPHAPEGAGAFRRRLHRRGQRLVRLATGIDEAVEAGFLRRRVEPAGPIVLELGSGYGREARILAGLHGSCAVIALDLSMNALAAAREESLGHGVSFLRADAAALPFADASVGAVDTFGLLHLVPDPATVVTEAARVLIPGGTFTGQTVEVPFSVRLPRSVPAGALGRACEGAGLLEVESWGRRGVTLFAWRKPATPE